jgi:hypothetical protein
MRQVAISRAEKFNGADLVRYEHHYERSYPIRGQQTNATLTPIPAAAATDVIDAT